MATPYTESGDAGTPLERPLGLGVTNASPLASGPVQAPAAAQPDEGFLTKFMRGLEYAGTPQGQLPLSVRLKQAAQEQEYKKAQLDNLGVERNKAALEMIPIIKNNLNGLDDVGKTKILPVLRNLMEGVSKGSGGLVDYISDNPFYVRGADLAMDQFVKKYPRMAPKTPQEYEALVKSPMFTQVSDQAGELGFVNVTSLLTPEDMPKLDGMKESVFKKLYHAAVVKDQALRGTKPGEAEFNELYLNTPQGQERMAGLGIQLDKTDLAHQTAEGRNLKLGALKRIEAQLATPNLDPATRVKLENERAIIEGTAAKPSSARVMQIDKFIEGKFGVQHNVHNMTELVAAEQAGTVAPGTTQAVTKEYFVDNPVTVQGGKATATNKAQQGMPLKQEERQDYYDRTAFLNTGQRLLPPAGTTRGDFNTKDYIKVTDKQVEQLGKLATADYAIKRAFGLADKFITATNAAGAVKQAAQLAALQLQPGYEDVRTYLAMRNAFVGTYAARTIGTEVGVLTTQDVDRWANTMPTRFDTVTTKNAKKQLYFDMLNFVQQNERRKIAGDLKPETDTAFNETKEKLLERIDGVHAQSKAEVGAVDSIDDLAAKMRAKRKEKR